MNQDEMRALLSEHLSRYCNRTYSELRVLVESKEVDTFEVRGATGADYQIEIQFFWDDKRREIIRVFGAIDENPHRPFFGFLPIYVSSVLDSLILSPQGTFVDE